MPTWNYAVVHVRGTVRLLEKYDEIIECLRSLTLQVEATAKDPWEFWLPEDLESPTDLTGAIAGLEIEISDIKGKFKMSQNRSETDRANVVGGLRSDRGDEKSLAVAKPHGKHFFTPARPGVVTSRISERRA